MLDEPGVKITFSFARQPAIERTWTWREFIERKMPEWFYAGDPPRWLLNPEMNVEVDPVMIVCSAGIPLGQESTAQFLLGSPE